MDPKLCIQLLPPLLLLFLNYASSEYRTMSSLHSFFKATSIRITDSRKELPPDFLTFYYTQTLDHFNYLPESYATFQQRYVVNSKYWGGANTNSPIFAYLGAETEIENEATLGFMTDNAPRFKALLIYIEEISESCYNTIRESWSKIDSVAAKPGGLNILSQKFNTCETVDSSDQLKNSIAITYIASAQYNAPPYYPVKRICEAIDGLPEGSDVISRISAGYKEGFGRIFNHTTCNQNKRLSSASRLAWYWQTCTEMVMPIGYNKNETMFEGEDPFDMNEVIRSCQSKFGVAPRPHWITTEYGGHNISSVLKNFASNIIFSNGLQDPFSVGGVLQGISNSIIALYTTQGSHVLDLHAANQSDPEWLVLQRRKEVEIIQGWIQEYNMST